ncbi:hypothetical protein [Streptomyces sp. NBC_01264]|uniref:hypothetical protein n=1 Tax=Streptomyces sp. NBC_01264 TaxID=2903804 RepID=UPI00225A0351|nr:hypothetical protein [Streptomyces sp. NBC_01264]MCX4784285.1 hypothetical protein [Streptomyces sp. NBC_01264]
MTRRLFRRCATASGTALAPEDQAAVDAFRAMLAALRTPEPWTPGCAQDVAVRVGAHIERAHPRPGDDHGPDVIAVALVHPDTPHAAAYAQRYTRKGWLRCETVTILGLWQPAYSALSHAASGLNLPDDVGMSPAHYGVDVEARQSDGSGFTALCLGPYTQIRHASRDADRLTTALQGQADTVIPGFTVTATTAAFDFDDRENYTDPYDVDITALLADALA